MCSTKEDKVTYELYQERQCAYNLTLRRIHETIAVEEKQYVLHVSECVCVCERERTWVIAWVCVVAPVQAYRKCSFTNGVFNALPVWLQRIIWHYLINWTIFGEKSYWI